MAKSNSSNDAKAWPDIDYHGKNSVELTGEELWQLVILIEAALKHPANVKCKGHLLWMSMQTRFEKLLNLKRDAAGVTS